MAGELARIRTRQEIGMKARSAAQVSRDPVGNLLQENPLSLSAIHGDPVSSR